jgi:hypothetical protein
MLRVGRRRYEKGKYTDPKFSNFTSILCLTKSTPYGSLGPYVLADNGGRFMENLYQYSKIYKTIPATVERYSRYDPTVIWKHPAETHIDADGNITPSYWKWRTKGFNNPYPVRYPVGFKHRNECVGSIISKDDTTLLDYITARKRIYWSLYRRMVKKQPQFAELKKRLADGENLLIIEVDGPHQESMDYYRDKYAVNGDFIVDHTVLATKKNLQLLLDDPKHPFGHGYCLAAALKGYKFK